MRTSIKSWAAVAATLAAAYSGVAQAQPHTVSVNLLANPVQYGVSRTSYGGGFDYANAFVKRMFDGTDKSWQMMAQTVKPGTVRFPQGTSALWYAWDNPDQSVQYGGVNKLEYMGPDVIYRNFTPGGTPANGQSPVGSETLFQINTYAYRENQSWLPVLTNGVINETTLDKVGEWAKRWVQHDRTKPCNQQTQYWEIGNEEYARMSAENYARIFKVIASKMLSVPTSPGCPLTMRLLATATALNFDYAIYGAGAFNQTDGEHWVQRFAGRLVSEGFDLNNVYAVTNHIYFDGNSISTLGNRATKMFSDIAKSTESLTLKAALSSNIRDYITPRPAGARYLPGWRVWMTEYNVLENAPVGSDAVNPGADIQAHVRSATATAQKKAHALLLADWTAKILSLGVERVILHSLDHEPRSAMFNYVNNGGTVANPIMMPGGLILAEMAQNFVGDVYAATNDSSSPFTPYGAFPTLASYATLQTIADGSKFLNLMLVNRDLNTGRDVKLQIFGKAFVPTGAVQTKLLTGELGTSNVDAPVPATPPVRWAPPSTFTAGACAGGWAEMFMLRCTLPSTLHVPKASVMMLRVPVQ